MKKNIFLSIIFLFISKSYFQENDYFKSSEMKGFPLLLKQVAKYENVKYKFDYFNLEEATYNSIFYQNLINENTNNASFKRLYAVLLKKFILKPKPFKDYQFILNPKIESGLYSKHRVAINIREESITADIQTSCIEIEFPEQILKTKDNKTSSILANIEKGITYNNEGQLNRCSGITINGIQNFTMKPSLITNSFIELTNFDKAEFKFINDEAYEFPFLIIDNNKLSNFINQYKLNNKFQNLKNLKEYKSAILLKNVQGLTTIDKNIKCEITEIYFFENIITGVIQFPSNQKTKLLADLNSIKTVINRSDFKLKTNGDFPSIYDSYKNTYYRLEQDSKFIKMYFIIVK